MAVYDPYWIALLTGLLMVGFILTWQSIVSKTKRRFSELIIGAALGFCTLFALIIIYWATGL